VVFIFAQSVDARGDVDTGEIIDHLCLNNEKICLYTNNKIRAIVSLFM
jgi:hypothetical protein